MNFFNKTIPNCFKSEKKNPYTFEITPFAISGLELKSFFYDNSDFYYEKDNKIYKIERKDLPNEIMFTLGTIKKILPRTYSVIVKVYKKIGFLRKCISMKIPNTELHITDNYNGYQNLIYPLEKIDLDNYVFCYFISGEDKLSKIYSEELRQYLESLENKFKEN
jgi:hypothetical protein